MSNVDEGQRKPKKAPEIKDDMGLSKSSFDMIASMFDSFEGLDPVASDESEAAPKLGNPKDACKIDAKIDDKFNAKSDAQVGAAKTGAQASDAQKFGASKKAEPVFGAQKSDALKSEASKTAEPVFGAQKSEEPNSDAQKSGASRRVDHAFGAKDSSKVAFKPLSSVSSSTKPVPKVAASNSAEDDAYDDIASMFDSLDELGVVPPKPVKIASRPSASKGGVLRSGGASEAQKSPVAESKSPVAEPKSPMAAKQNSAKRIDDDSKFEHDEDETLDMPCSSDLFESLSHEAIAEMSQSKAKDAKSGGTQAKSGGKDGDDDSDDDDVGDRMRVDTRHGVGGAKDVGQADTLERIPAETCQGVGGMLPANTTKKVSSDELPMGYVVKRRYRIESVIGSGGFGVVYRAIDTEEMNRVVAVKTLRHKIEDYNVAVMRFKREIAICEKLDNPHIVRVFDHGTTADDDPQQGVDADTLYYVMEFIEGKTLDDYIERRQKFSFFDVKSLMLQVLDGLAVAHRDSIVHRDLKPANICLKPQSADSNDFIVKLLDFGIARAIEGDDSTAQKVTQTGAWMGSPAYMSPEQLKGYAPTPASDIFAIGLIMIEMLTCVQAVNADSAMDAAMMILSPDPLDDDDWYWLRDTAIWTVIEKCIQKDPLLRFKDASECFVALSALDDNTLKNEYVSAKMRKRSRTGGRMSQATTPEVTPANAQAVSQQTLISQQLIGANNNRTMLNTILLVFIIVGIIACATIIVVKLLIDDTHDPSAVAAEELSARDKLIVRSAAFGAMEGALPLFRMNVMISSMPAGAEVYRESDNHLLGKTPIAISVVPTFEAWKLRLKADGFVEYPFLVNALMPTPVNLNMQPVAPGDSAKAVAENKPLIDGNPKVAGAKDDNRVEPQIADKSKKDLEQPKIIQEQDKSAKDKSDKSAKDKSHQPSTDAELGKTKANKETKKDSKKDSKRDSKKTGSEKKGFTADWRVDGL